MQVHVSLRGIHREIGAAVRKLRRARRHAKGAEQAQLDALTRQLQDLERRTTGMCGRVYGVWPPPAKGPAKGPARPPAPKPPAKPAKPKKGGRKPARPKKAR